MDIVCIWIWHVGDKLRTRLDSDMAGLVCQRSYSRGPLVNSLHTSWNGVTTDQLTCDAKTEIEAQENEAKLTTGSADDETCSISTLCRCIVPVASGLLVQMLVRYHLQSRTSIQNSTGEEKHWSTRKCYQRHSQMRIPEELVSRSFSRRLVPFCRASSYYVGPKFPISKFSRISRRGNRSTRNRFAFCVFGKTEDEELFREGQRKRKDMGSGCKKTGEKNKEGEGKCGNLEKNTKRMKHICSWMNLTHETVCDQTV